MNGQRDQVFTFAIALLMSVLVIGVGLSATACYATDPEDLPWDNETDVIIFPSPPLPPFFSDFNITPTEIELGDDLSISFVIRNPNNRSITRMSATRIGDFFTQIIEIELDAYESKLIWYRIIPHAAGEYDVWIDGQTGTFRVISTEIIITDPLEELNLKIDRIDDAIAELFGGLFGLGSRIDVLETSSVEVNEQIMNLENKISGLQSTINEQIESLENKISNLQANIVYACIATAIIAILGAFLLIKRMN